jgi:hypothetical protein
MACIRETGTGWHYIWSCAGSGYLLSIAHMPEFGLIVAFADLGRDDSCVTNPLLQQLPALVGVVVGGAATYAATSLLDRARWRRERDERWDAARMQGYAEFANAVKEVFTIATRIAAGRGLPYATDPLTSDEESASALTDAESKRAHAWESVLLLGAPETVEAGRAWWHEVWRFVWFARGWIDDPQQWEAAQSESELARQRFYDCARRDLGVKGAASTIGPLQPRWMHNGQTSDGQASGSVSPLASQPATSGNANPDQPSS